MSHYTLVTPDRDTYLRIITVSLTLSIVIAWLAIALFG
jgi:hypothetical protein